eukprot:m.116566 g.116566  ORF g.116566 m.116566 type:complete len:82 (+) comp23046_c1_seq2:98-343(+)
MEGDCYDYDRVRDHPSSSSHRRDYARVHDYVRVHYDHPSSSSYHRDCDHGHLCYLSVSVVAVWVVGRKPAHQLASGDDGHK